MNKNLIGIIVLVIVAAILWLSLKQEPATPSVSEDRVIGNIDNARINNADTEPGNWLAYGRTYEEQRFSPLNQINRNNVSELGLAWYKDMQSNRSPRRKSGS